MELHCSKVSLGTGVLPKTAAVWKIPRKGASDNPNYPLFHTDAALAGWKKVIDAVHDEGGKMGPQIWHQGLLRKSGTGHFPDAPTDSPSGVTHKGKQIFEAPSEEEVRSGLGVGGRGDLSLVYVHDDRFESDSNRVRDTTTSRECPCFLSYVSV